MNKEIKAFESPNFESFMLNKLDILKIVQFSDIKSKWYWYC